MRRQLGTTIGRGSYTYLPMFSSSDATGDTASWMWVHCLSDWDQAGQYSWGFVILGFLYR